MNKSTAHFHIDSEKLTAITNIINRDTDPAATEEFVLENVCADWNEGAEHQDWIDQASAEEIADWLKTFYAEG